MAEITIRESTYWFDESRISLKEFIHLRNCGLHIRYLHRLDGPAMISTNGSEFWFRLGKQHRFGGPAFKWPNGYKKWYQYGIMHRLDGPAIEYEDGKIKWIIWDHVFSEEEHKEYVKLKEEDPVVHKLYYSGIIDLRNETY